jgi:EAL domain-containing protein (putative c-di-GMP-specific phosphodiesterase class I)
MLIEKGGIANARDSRTIMNLNTAMNTGAEIIDLASHSKRLERNCLERELRNAIASEEFVLHYQPQLDYAGNLTGAEALIRWRRSGSGLVFPTAFIDFAEETGLIIDIGAWALYTACQQLSIWQRKSSTRNLTIAVNISAMQLNEAGFVALVIAMIDITGANPHLLKLELTESLAVAEIECAAEKMKVLRALGVSFSLDDFGTGHSSLVYLRELPLDQLKIDQSFVRDIDTNCTNAVIVRSTVDLARGLGLAIIAEGVETSEQRDMLARCGCYDYQGYFYHRALPVNEFNQLAQ